MVCADMIVFALLTTAATRNAPKILPSDCVANGTLVGSVASLSYYTALVELAATAVAAGFRCIAAQAMDEMVDQRIISDGSTTVAMLPAPASRLQPEARWCDPGMTMRVKYGWRRSHLYRVLMWRNVLSLGYDLLAVDCDWRFVSSPLPSILSIWPKTDVIAYWDGVKQKMLNVGLMWLRSTPDVLATVKRVQNRTWAGWEQAVFTEELNWRSNASCCHCSPCLLKHHFEKSLSTHQRQRNVGAVRERFRNEGQPVCSETLAPSADDPPFGSLFVWKRQGNHSTAVAQRRPWGSTGWNELIDRKVGRCTTKEAACVGAWKLSASAPRAARSGDVGNERVSSRWAKKRAWRSTLRASDEARGACKCWLRRRTPGVD